MLVRKFIKEELSPLEREVDEKNNFPDDLRRRLRQKAVKLGLHTYHTPIEYGGGGVGALGSVLVHEELGKVSHAVGLQGGVIGALREDLLLDANEDQKERYLFPYLRGEKELFIGLTEPNAGSDMHALETRAMRDGNKYILSGTKTFITMAQRSDFGLVWAVTDSTKPRKGRITCFLVDKDTAGFSVSRDIPMLGRRGLDTCELSFVDCVIPQENVLGEVGNGLRIFDRFATIARLGQAAYCVGAAQRVYDMSVDYAKQRVTFGQPLAKRQAIQFMIVDTAIDIDITRLMTYNAAWEYDSGMDTRTKAMMAKVFASEMAFRAVDRAMQIHGGYGYTMEGLIPIVYGDVRSVRIGEGALEVGKSWIASRLLGIPFE
jgi:alkylation response protein AidB-like acyl-CoA dehydrogenase